MSNGRAISPTCAAEEAFRYTDPARRFITLEGIEGAGKTTRSRRSRSSCARAASRSPRASRAAPRSAERSARWCSIAARSTSARPPELLLMFGARQAHRQPDPAGAGARRMGAVRSLHRCDHAYQGGGRGVDRGLIEQLARIVHGDLTPDCTLLLDVPVRVGLERDAGAAAAAGPFRIRGRRSSSSACATLPRIARARTRTLSRSSMRRAEAKSHPRSRAKSTRCCRSRVADRSQTDSRTSARRRNARPTMERAAVAWFEPLRARIAAQQKEGRLPAWLPAPTTSRAPADSSSARWMRARLLCRDDATRALRSNARNAGWISRWQPSRISRWIGVLKDSKYIRIDQCARLSRGALVDAAPRRLTRWP